jgi:hypothetical protein
VTSVYRLPEHPVPQPFSGPQESCPYCGSWLYRDPSKKYENRVAIIANNRSRISNISFGSVEAKEARTTFASCSPVKRYRYGFFRWWRRCQHSRAHVHQWCLSCRSEWIVWPATPIAPESLPRVKPPEPRPAPPPPRLVSR